MKTKLFRIEMFFFLIMGLALIPGAVGGHEDKPIAKKIKGGASYGAAVPMELSRDFKLAHHQKKGDFDYFSITAPPDALLMLEVQTLQKGISFNDGRRTVTTEPFAGLKLLDEKQKVLQSVEIEGRTNTTQNVSFRNRNPQQTRYYVAVGSDKGSIHRDQMIFKVAISPFVYGDLGTDQDTGPLKSGAFPVAVNTHYGENSIGGGDFMDSYVFNANEQEWYTVAVRAKDSIKAPFNVTVYGPKKETLTSYVSGSAEEIITRSFEIRKRGPQWIEISLRAPAPEKSLYSIEVLKVREPDKK